MVDDTDGEEKRLRERSENMVQLKYDITPAEHLEMIKAVRFSTGHQLMRMSLFGFGLLVSLSAYKYFGLTWVLLATVFAVLFCMQPILPYIVHSRIYGRNPRLFRVRTTTFDDEGVKSDRDIYHIEIKWRGIEKFAETKNLFITFQSKDAVSIVPKRAFRDEAEITQFRMLLSSKITASRES